MKLKDSIIIILLVIIAIGIGVLVGVKLTEDRYDNPPINNESTNNNQEQNNNKDENEAQKDNLYPDEPTTEELNSKPLVDNLGDIVTFNLAGKKDFDFDLEKIIGSIDNSTDERVVSARITNIKVNNKIVNMYWMNVTYDDSKCVDIYNPSNHDKYYQLYLNDKLLNISSYGLCPDGYLSEFHIVYDKYIAIKYGYYEGSQGLIIYDENGNKIDDSVRGYNFTFNGDEILYKKERIVSEDEDYGTYKYYEDKYSYDVSSGKGVSTLIEKGTVLQEGYVV